MGRNTAFDVILGIMLGSVVSRAVTGNSPLLPTLTAAVVLVGLHWAFALVAFHWHPFGVLVKGRQQLLVRDGEVLWDAMRRTRMSERDLAEALRLEGLERPEQVALAHFERNGRVSVVPRTRSEPSKGR
jgi:uncharacterized membrane protein YcaP (DUF421 family)